MAVQGRYGEGMSDEPDQPRVYPDEIRRLIERVATAPHLYGPIRDDADDIDPVTPEDDDFSSLIDVQTHRRGWAALIAASTNAMTLIRNRTDEWKALTAGTASPEQMTRLRTSGVYENQKEMTDAVRDLHPRYWPSAVGEITGIGDGWVKQFGPVDVNQWERAVAELIHALVRPRLLPAVTRFNDLWWTAQRQVWTGQSPYPAMAYVASTQTAVAPVMAMAIIVAALVGVVSDQQGIARAVSELIDRVASFVQLG